MRAGEGDASAVEERMERLLRVPADMGLRTRAQCLEHLGGLFRGTLGTPGHLTDMQARTPPWPLPSAVLAPPWHQSCWAAVFARLPLLGSDRREDVRP